MEVKKLQFTGGPFSCFFITKSLNIVWPLLVVQLYFLTIGGHKNCSNWSKTSFILFTPIHRTMTLFSSSQFFFKNNGPSSASFPFIFDFSSSHYNSYNKYIWKSPSRCWDPNSQPSEHETPPKPLDHGSQFTVYIPHTVSLNPDALEYNIMEVAEQWLGRLKGLIQNRIENALNKNLKIASKTHRNIPTNRTQRLWNSIWEHFLLVKFSFTFYN